MTTLVTGSFEDAEHANQAVQALIEAEFEPDDISVVVADREGDYPVKIGHDTGIAEGAAIGGALGAALGALGATLVSTGVLVAPGITLWAAGPLLAAVAGGGAGAAMGAVAGLGVWKEDAHLQAEDLRGGSVLIGVHADGSRIETARKVLLESGATRVLTA